MQGRKVNQSKLMDAILSPARVAGLTHNFYRYPARFSPQALRQIVSQFSSPGDWILDPFMGGGTAVVEAISMGRYTIGIDLNPLAHFVTDVKTTPISDRDEKTIVAWLGGVERLKVSQGDSPVSNLPDEIYWILSRIISKVEDLPLKRQRRFIRCALLKTGQWAVDCRDRLPSKSEILQKLQTTVGDMFYGLSELVSACGHMRIAKQKITSRRRLFCRSTVGIELDSNITGLPSRPCLVITSPPYPAVHILYHRWQIRGRRETPAPYWIAGLNDGHFESYYRFGSRSKLGLQNYFQTLTAAFQSIKKIIHPEAFVIQLVAFSRTESQLPLYLDAMHAAGFKEQRLLYGESRITRDVPNRKWYSRILEQHDAAKEVLLMHRPT